MLKMPKNTEAVFFSTKITEYIAFFSPNAKALLQKLVATRPNWPLRGLYHQTSLSCKNMGQP